MKNWSIPLLLLTFGIFLGCDRVKETPEPDTFSSITLLDKQILARGGTAEFDLMAMFGIRDQVNVSFEKSKWGTITSNSNGTKFIYKAIRGFEKEDSIRFEICRPPDCKKGLLRIVVSDNQCFPIYNSSNEHEVYLKAEVGREVYRIPFFPGDFYCPNDHQKIDLFTELISEPWFQEDSISIKPKDFPIVQKIESTIKYSNGDPSQPFPYRQRTIRVIVDTSKNYCESIFDVKDWGSVLVLGRDFTVSRSTFINRGLILHCKDDLSMKNKSWGIVTSQHLTISENHDDGGRVIRRNRNPALANAPGEKFIKYYFKNQTESVTDTGKIVVTF